MWEKRVWAGNEEKDPPTLSPRLLLVDIENLCGEPRPHPKRISAAKKFLDVLVGTDSSTDQYIIGCHHTIQKDVETVWRDSKATHWQLRVRSGKDGADIALGAWLKSNVSKLDSYNSLVIGSGDHFFADDSFVRTAYLKFSPNHILQVASSPSNKSHKFEDFKHHVSYFSEVHPKPISLLSEQEVDTASKRYAVLGRKLLGVKAFKDGRKPVSSEEAVNQQPKVSFMRRILENSDADVPVDDFHDRKLLRDGIEFEFFNWFRQHDWEFNDKVYLSSATMERVELADSGDSIVATDSEGIETIYVVS